MQITELRLTRRGRYAVYLDGAFALAIGKDTLLDAGLRVGDHLDPDQLDALGSAELLHETQERALRLLSMRDHSAAELREKLIRSAPAAIAEAVVARMIGSGLIDDRRFAAAYLAYLREQKGMAGIRLRQELRRKGIDRAIIDEVIEEVEAEEPAEAADDRLHQLIERKYLRMLDSEKGRARAAQALLRLGYRWGEIRDAFASYLSDLPED